MHLTLFGVRFGAISTDKGLLLTATRLPKPPQAPPAATPVPEPPIALLPSSGPSSLKPARSEAFSHFLDSLS